MTLEALLHNPNALPAAPKVVEQLIASFDDPDVAVDAIARTLSTDPVLSAKLLRLANSAYYHVSRSIGTVDTAVRMLGFVTVRTLVISSGLVSGFKTVPGIDLKRFWRYSLHTAVGAKWIARKTGENGDLAFTIGMMHAIGQLVMHAGEPERSLALDKIADPYDERRLKKEAAMFGYDFSEVGAELALRWKFPDIFPDTIRDFPHPARHAPPNRMAAVIHLAVWRAQRDERRPDPDELPPRLPQAAAQCLDCEAGALFDEMPAPGELAQGLEELVH